MTPPKWQMHPGVARNVLQFFLIRDSTAVKMLKLDQAFIAPHPLDALPQDSNNYRSAILCCALWRRADLKIHVSCEQKIEVSLLNSCQRRGSRWSRHILFPRQCVNASALLTEIFLKCQTLVGTTHLFTSRICMLGKCLKSTKPR